MRWLASLTLCLCLAFQAAGQGIVWEKRFGWVSVDELTDVIATPDGNFMACGISYNFGIDDFRADRHNGICLVSIFPSGDTAWVKPTGLYGRSPRLCLGDSETFYLVSTPTFTPPSNLRSYLAISRIRFDGTVVWTRSIPNTNMDWTEARRIVLDSRGRILVVGQAPGTGPALTYDMFALMVDTSGIIRFNKRYNDNPRTMGNWIEQTPEGTFLASGAAGSRIWAIEIDSGGREIRRQVFYETPTRAVFGETAAVKQAPGGRYIASGSPLSFSPGFYFLGSFSGFSSSAQVWGGERSPAVCLPPHVQQDGSLVFYSGRGSTSRYLTKLASDSTVVWDRLLTSQFGSFPPGILAFSYLGDSSVIAVGSYYTSSTAKDFYLARIRGVGLPFDPAQPVSNKPRHKGLPTLIAYPTPTHGPLTVHTRSRLPLVLYSLSGKKVLEVKADPTGTTVVDMSGLPKGLYVLRQGEQAVRVLKG